MGADMYTASIAVPAYRAGPPDFDNGRRLVESIDDVAQFTFDDPSDVETEIRDLLPDFDPASDVVNVDGEPLLEVARRAGLAVIDGLQEALASREVSSITVAGYEVYVSGGLSASDPPTDAAEQIWNAYKLPVSVLLAMGFIPDYSKPLARKSGSPDRVTDTDIVDAIALGLGTKSEWSGSSELEWIAEAISKVRTHPGNTKAAAYLRDFTERYEFDPTTSNFLSQYVDEGADEEMAENDEVENGTPVCAP